MRERLIAHVHETGKAHVQNPSNRDRVWGGVGWGGGGEGGDDERGQSKDKGGNQIEHKSIDSESGERK